MNGSVLLMALLSASVGLAIGFASVRGALVAVAAMVAVALLIASMPLPQSMAGVIRAGLCLSVIATAALAFLSRGASDFWALAAGINGGVWLGALASLSPRLADLFLILPLSFSFLPAQWLTGRGYAIVPRVVLSWIVAIASLALFVSLMPSKSYQPDHME